MKLFSVKYKLENEEMTYGNMTLGISNDSSPECYIYYVILPDSEKRHYFSDKDLLFALELAILCCRTYIAAKNMIPIFTEIEHPCEIISDYKFQPMVNLHTSIRVELSKESIDNIYSIVLYSTCGESCKALYFSDKDIFNAINKMIRTYFKV